MRNIEHLGRLDPIDALDNAGNCIGEITQAPGDSLRRQLTRNIDALGRVQQIMGRP
jgi:hypothetical protein